VWNEGVRDSPGAVDRAPDLEGALDEVGGGLEVVVEQVERTEEGLDARLNGAVAARPGEGKGFRDEGAGTAIIAEGEGCAGERLQRPGEDHPVVEGAELGHRLVAGLDGAVDVATENMGVRDVREGECDPPAVAELAPEVEAVAVEVAGGLPVPAVHGNPT